MKLFMVFGILFYTVVIIFIGVVLIFFSLGFLQPQDIDELLALTHYNTKIAIGMVGLLLILISISFAQLVLGRFQRQKMIAFSTSTGQVTIALSAVEDLIKRLGNITPEIKELRPNVVASKKGLVVDLRVILRSEANIPELTTRLQEVTRNKIQEVLGLEEQITIKIHVAKIITSDEKKRKDPESAEPTIPYSGYGRV
ncbi:alkaline shock response membrane anchor protein AmaP [Candidatus Omnitrophota bacterium]